MTAKHLRPVEVPQPGTPEANAKWHCISCSRFTSADLDGGAFQTIVHAMKHVELTGHEVHVVLKPREKLVTA